jgi:uncharacterized membrane protein
MRGWGRLLGWAGFMVAVGLVPLVLGWSHMPDPVATHWGFDGVPNGYKTPSRHIGALMVCPMGTCLSWLSLC